MLVLGLGAETRNYLFDVSIDFSARRSVRRSLAISALVPFGDASGEGISSRRVAGHNRFGIDF